MFGSTGDQQAQLVALRDLGAFPPTSIPSSLRVTSRSTGRSRPHSDVG
jgi:hypothetical protein